jgi:hypothetical protein
VQSLVRPMSCTAEGAAETTEPRAKRIKDARMVSRRSIWCLSKVRRMVKARGVEAAH